jgi:ABC transporter substrate binding protein
MDRRAFISMMSGSILARPIVAKAQPRGSKVYRIGVLEPYAASDPINKQIRQAFRDVGYSEGGDLLIEWRYGEGQTTRLPTSLRIIDAAARNRLPAIYQWEESVRAGGLMSYGPNRLDVRRVIAVQLERVLKGAKTADLPIEQPSKFELAINLKTAKVLGLTIPQSVLGRADQVIE